MDKYQAAIAEYEAARIEIKNIAEQIGLSIGEYANDKYIKKCACDNHSDDIFADTDCVKMLWAWNKQYAADREEWESAGGSLCGPFEPDVPPAPVLCEAGKITQKLVDDRKVAKKRFGIAKRRISAMAKTLLAERGVA